jgi:hypothetical protein
MANSILSSALSQTSFKVINVYTNVPTLQNLKIIRVRMRYAAKNLSHIMEDGSYEVDSRIILPMACEVTCICPDIDTQSQIITILKDCSAFYVITTKGMILENMVVDEESIEQTPKVLSASPITLRFKQVLVGNVSPVYFAQPADSSVIDHGFALLHSATSAVNNLYSSVSSYASSAASTVSNLIP